MLQVDGRRMHLPDFFFFLSAFGLGLGFALAVAEFLVAALGSSRKLGSAA